MSMVQNDESPIYDAPGSLPPAFRIYAIGDVHGRADLLQDVLLKIVSDIGRAPSASPMVILLGDYLDRGPRSAEVINLILSAQRHLPMVCLSGNHELYALQFMRLPSTGPSWFEIGGRETLVSYGIEAPWRPKPAEFEELSRRFAQALPQDHRDFLTNLGLSVCFGDYVFVHAGTQPDVPIAEQGSPTLTLVRNPFLGHSGSFGRIVVHGHTPVEEPDIRSNRINIDTGAYITGRLTCLVLEERTLRFL